IPGPIAGVMTKPDRLSTANAVAKASAFSTAAAEPHGEAVSRADHDRMANAIRALAMDAVEQAKSGHPGLPMGAADIATVLFTRFLKFDPADPAWPDRDRFVLSAGHGSMLLYALLHLLGYEKMTIEQIKRFRQIGSLTPGHPQHGPTPGVQTTTGPPRQGPPQDAGMAIAERHLAAIFGAEIVDHATFVLASDGDLMEGISQEAIALAGHLRLHKLTVLFDDNGISIDGATSLADSVNQVKRFESAGWAATQIDGQDPAAIARAIEAARHSDRPSLIACRTTIGYGAPSMAAPRDDVGRRPPKKGRHKKRPRSAPGPGGAPGATKRARRPPPPVKNPRRYPGAVARRGRTQPPGTARLGAACGGVRSGAARRIHPPFARQGDRADRACRGRGKAKTCAGAKGPRHPQRFRTRAGSTDC